MNSSLIVMQMPGLMKILEQKIGRLFTRVSGLILVVVFILHAFACLFHFVAVLNTDSATWIETSGLGNDPSTLDRYVRIP